MGASQNQLKKARQFFKLHQNSGPFILANAWDAISAKIFEIEGFKAIGTTSAGISSVLGYPDGETMQLKENLFICQRIIESNSLPVSIDLEAGYGTTPQNVARSAEAVIKIGAVGINLEDSTGVESSRLYDIDLQQEKIRAVKEMSDSEKMPLFVNARTDTFLFSNDPIKVKLQQTIKRGNAYKEAGADCIFVPDMGDLDTTSISILLKEIPAPLNIIAGSTTPSLQQLQEMGVSRISLGPRHMRVMLSLLQKIAIEIQTKGTYKLMSESSISYSDINGWFGKS